MKHLLRLIRIMLDSYSLSCWLYCNAICYLCGTRSFYRFTFIGKEESPGKAEHRAVERTVGREI